MTVERLSAIDPKSCSLASTSEPGGQGCMKEVSWRMFMNDAKTEILRRG